MGDGIEYSNAAQTDATQVSEGSPARIKIGIIGTDPAAAAAVARVDEHRGIRALETLASLSLPMIGFDAASYPVHGKRGVHHDVTGYLQRKGRRR